MNRSRDLLLTALAPAVWGSTYLVTTEWLPDGYPITAAMLRALPAGFLLLLIVRRLPTGTWWAKVTVLGALNFALFWWCLFIAAYRLPGGVAATVGAVQPLIVLLLARSLLGESLRVLALVAAVGGIGGVALLVLTPQAAIDTSGVIAALAGAVSMAFGTVLSRRWQAPVSALTFTAWQLLAGGLLLLPASLLLEPPLPALGDENVWAFLYLGLIGGAMTYLLWFRGIARLGPSTVAPLGLLSPAMAVVLGWVVLGQELSAGQSLGMLVVLLSVWAGQHAQRGNRLPKARRAALPGAEPTGLRKAV